MKTNLSSSEFLVWRQPGQSVFVLHKLEHSAKAAGQFVASSFLGEVVHYGITSQYEITIDDLPFIAFPQVEAEMETFSRKEEEYTRLVAKAVSHLKNSSMHKVVLSRPAPYLANVKAGAWFLALADAYKNSCVFAFYTHQTGFWMGATPEQLLKVESGMATAVSLAGTRKGGGTVAWGKKEVEEQNLVTQGISNEMKAAGLQNIAVTATQTVQAGPVEHLRSFVMGRMPEQTSALNLALALHPTPAVGGLPKKEAVAYITKNEGYNRSFYTGFFGVTRNNEANFWVNLRCMQLFWNGLVLYAGGGITAASNPQLEWEETCNKLQTLTAIIKRD
jgi:isochorismate synthase